MAKVIVLLGSASDAEKMRPCLETLDKFGIDYFATVSSAHRTPERTAKLVSAHEEAEVFICAAGMAAHLAGAVAARTIKPVIGVPISGNALAGLDALFSTSQMPGGFPVATMALDQAGAKNAAWLAMQILALNDRQLRDRLEKARQEMAENVEKSANILISKN